MCRPELGQRPVHAAGESEVGARHRRSGSRARPTTSRTLSLDELSTTSTGRPSPSASRQRSSSSGDSVRHDHDVEGGEVGHSRDCVIEPVLALGDARPGEAPRRDRDRPCPSVARRSGSAASSASAPCNAAASPCGTSTPGVADDFGQCAGGARDDGHARRHRLDRDPAELLGPASASRATEPRPRRTTGTRRAARRSARTRRCVTCRPSGAASRRISSAIGPSPTM